MTSPYEGLSAVLVGAVTVTFTPVDRVPSVAALQVEYALGGELTRSEAAFVQGLGIERRGKAWELPKEELGSVIPKPGDRIRYTAGDEYPVQDWVVQSTSYDHVLAVWRCVCTGDQP